MGDLISSHLDESKREIITVRTGEVMGEFGRLYEKQYVVALFNKVRYDVEGGGGPQPQLLHRKVPLENKSIFSGSLFQYLEENKKWRNRFLFVPDSYNINYYENKQGHDRGLQPKGTINCAGYKVLTSMEKYLELLESTLPDVKAKVGSSPFLKCVTQFPLILWHPYARHHYFCVSSEKEQEKWSAVLQDCVRHANNGLSEECKIQTPAFTDAVRLYRQARGQYGTWDMMCGLPPQILANLVMEKLIPELRDLISPRLKGKLQERQKSWILISDAVYSLVQNQTQSQYEAIVQSAEAGRPPLEATIRTDMDQIITSKEHVTGKIRALVLPKAEKLLKVSIQPYINSILEALMEPTSRGFFEVRDVFFRELVNMSKNLLNGGTKEKLGEHMEKISMLAFHPVKMQCCYEKVEQLSLEGLQQRFDVTSPSVFVQRAQILMREQMDDAVYTFEHLLHQSLEGQEEEDLCKTIQKCQERVIKKFDYDSSTVRKKFFREALLQIFIPYMLKQLSPSCSADLPRFQELIFEDFSRFILVENIFEEVVLQTVMKDIMMAVKEAAVQRRHNLYRDSIVLTNSDPNLHLLEENPPINWTEEYGENQEEVDGDQGGEGGDTVAQKRRRLKQVVSMIQEDGTATAVPGESCLEVPGVEDIPEEEGECDSSSESEKTQAQTGAGVKEDVKEVTPLPNGTTLKEEKTTNSSLQEAVPRSPQDPETRLAIESAIQEIENAVHEEESDAMSEPPSSPKTEEPQSPRETTGTLGGEEVESVHEGQRVASGQEDKVVSLNTEEQESPARSKEIKSYELRSKELKSDELKSEEPSSEEPKSDGPRSEELKSDGPRSEELKSDGPRSEELKSDELKSEEPRSEELKSDGPRSEELKSEEPRSEELKSDKLKSEEPRSEELKSDGPRSEELKSEEPRSEEPKSEEPITPTQDQQSHEMIAMEKASESHSELEQKASIASSHNHDDSGFQSPANEAAEQEEPEAAIATTHTQAGKEKCSDSETGEEDAGKGADTC